MPFELLTESFETHDIHVLEFSGSLDNSDYFKFKNCFDVCLDGKHFCMIFRMDKVDYVPPSMMMKLAQYLIERETKTKNKLIASSIITKSSIIKNLLNTLFAVKPPIAPNIVGNDEKDCREFLEDNIELFHFNKNKR